MTLERDASAEIDEFLRHRRPSEPLQEFAFSDPAENASEAFNGQPIGPLWRLYRAECSEAQVGYKFDHQGLDALTTLAANMARRPPLRVGS